MTFMESIFHYIGYFIKIIKEVAFYIDRKYIKERRNAR